MAGFGRERRCSWPAEKSREREKEIKRKKKFCKNEEEGMGCTVLGLVKLIQRLLLLLISKHISDRWIK